MERRQLNAIITVLAALAAAGAVGIAATSLADGGAEGERPQGGIRVSGDFHWAIPDRRGSRAQGGFGGARGGNSAVAAVLEYARPKAPQSIR